MSDVSVRMTLQDDVSAKMQRITASARTAATQFSNAGRAMDSAFRSSAATSFASQAGSAFNSVESDAEALGNAIDDAVSGLESFSAGDTRGMGSAFSEAADNADDLSDSASRASESVDDLADATGDLGDGADGMDSLAGQVDDAGSSMEEASSKAINLSGALKTLFAVVSAAAIIGQVKDFAADSIELGKNYTSVMSEVAAISGASSSDLAMMEDTARQYGATTVFSASEAAEALKYMSLAGWDAQQSTDALGGVLNLAAASSMGLGEASDMVTDYLSAFGMEANKSTYFADMLAYAQSNSNTTAAQLGEAYKNSAANMHAAGQDVETTTSLLEAMANQGRKGSEAGTTLGAMMRDITAKMDDGAIKIGETSIAVQDASGNFRDMTDILTEVGEATEGMGSAQRAAALSSVFTDDSIKGVNMVLAEGMDKVAGYEEALRSATGASEDMAETMNDNLSGDMANMNSAYEEMQLQTFEAMEGPLREGAQWITSDIIPTLTSWVPDAFGTLASGISKVGNALSPMIKTVLQNPKAVASAFASIGAGFAAMKTVNTGIKIAGMVSEAGGMASALGKLGTSLFGSPWAAGAAAAVAAITAVGLAVKKYNDIQVEDSLSAHFGSVELDDSQIEDFASRVIDAQWLVNINAAIGHFENAEEFNQQAEEALAANDALEWKARVGIQLTEDEQSSYMQNIETFKENIEQALTEQTLAAKMTVNEFDIKMADGSSLGSQIEKWAEQDLGEMQSLSAGLTNLVQTALEDGIIDVDEQAAIDQLQGKINNIMEGWQEAEAQAQMDVLTQKYGRLSGKDLTADTFTKVVEELGEQRETATAALETSEKKLYTTLNALNKADENGVQRISDEELVSYKQQAGYAVRNDQASMLGNSLEFEKNTLSDAYGEKLDSNYSAIQEQTGNFLNNANSYLANQDYMSLVNSMQSGFSSAMTGTSIFSDKDQKALSKIYDSMKPDVESMAGLIDEYREMGQAVPQDVMTAFNDAVQVGAAAGDADAAWQVFANQMIADPASEALVQAIQDGTVSVPEELKTAIDRATTDIDPDPVTIEGMQAEVDDVEVNQDHVDQLIQDALGDLGTVEGEVDGDIQIKVEKGNCLSQIGEALGVDWHEIAEYNGIEDPYTIYPDMELKIPKEKVDTDASGVGEAAEEAAKSETGETIETEQGVKTTLTDEGVDGSQTAQAAEEEAKSQTAETVEREQPVKTNMTNAGVDDSQVTQAAQEQETQAEPKETDVPTTIKFEVASLDDSELASAISEKLQQGEAVPVEVPANVTIKAGAIDDTQLSSEITGKLGEQSAVPVNVPANITLTAGNVDSSQAVATTQSDVISAFSAALPADGTVDVALAKGNDNIASVYDYVGGLVRSAWANPYSASGTVHVTLTANYSLANPTKTISFGGGATGSATVTAALHAAGGIFDEPHLGMVAEAGPEAIIPLDGSGNAMELWQEAGKRLGALEDGPIQIAPSMYSGGKNTDGNGQEAKASSNRTIDININGNGSITAGKGVSKDDIVQVLMEKVRDVFVNIVTEEALVGGDTSYEF
ncbi:phage tail tape measure protein [Blautia massiliensis (ex Durand et al. 2017)]|uniref:phage tail tape measure protein n=1 Tax=Blautia massiliensis (ex Durand et al. 2017) TaxID=1737424 RepID=UPI00189ED554|nr:phage tail tape measure protein [Blautia massiliensis (ex Durand et al. 2017)]